MESLEEHSELMDSLKEFEKEGTAGENQ